MRIFIPEYPFAAATAAQEEQHASLQALSVLSPVFTLPAEPSSMGQGFGPLPWASEKSS